MRDTLWSCNEDIKSIKSSSMENPLQPTTKISEKLEESVLEDSKFRLNQDIVPRQLRMQVKKLSTKESQHESLMKSRQATD